MRTPRLWFVLPLLCLVAPAAAQVDPKVAEQCKDARDFVGCVKAFTTPAAAPEDALSSLRKAMKQVAGRLAAGTSLQNSTNTFQPVVDELASVEADHPKSLNVIEAKRASRLFNVLQASWRAQIRAKNYQLSSNMFSTEDFYDCSILQRISDAFDSEYGSSYIGFTFRKGMLGSTLCRSPKGSSMPVDKMISAVISVLRNGAKSPSEIAAEEKAEAERKAKEARELELCQMGPWNRYLEENAKMKAWAKANPAAAEKAKEKYIKDPKNQADCRVGLEKIYGDAPATEAPAFFVP